MDLTDSSLSARIANSFEKLSSAAKNLNNVSDELGKAVASIDAVLQSLGLGVSTWTPISEGSELPEDTHYWHRDVGYTKVGHRWGIALRDVSGDYQWPERENCDLWLFNEAPRWLRIEGVAKIPALLDALIKKVEETTEAVRTKTIEANQLAAAIAEAAKEKQATTSPIPHIPVVRNSASIGSKARVSLQIDPPWNTQKPKGGK
jgi:hypothetical protein